MSGENKEATEKAKMIKDKLKKNRLSRRKKLLLIIIPLTICLFGAGYAIWRHKHYNLFSPQGIFNHQTKEINKMIKSISKINDPSMRFFLSQEYIYPMQREIKDQLKNGDGWSNRLVDFYFYYTHGLILAIQKIDKNIQEYKKVYDGMVYSEKNQSVDPYRNIISKVDNDWYDNPNNPISFYFDSLNQYEKAYNMDSLNNYLTDFVKLVTISEHQKEDDQYQIKKFVKDNKLEIYTPDELADYIIKEIIELESLKTNWSFKDLEAIFGVRYMFSKTLEDGIVKYIDLKDATFHINRAIYSLSWKKRIGVLKDIKENSFESRFMKNVIVNYFAKQLKEKATKYVEINEYCLNKFLKEGMSRKQAELASKEKIIELNHKVFVKGSFH